MELVRQWKVLAVGLQVFVLLLTDAVEGTFEKEGYQLFKDGSLQEAVEDEVRLMLLEDWADDNDNDEWMEPHVLSSRGDLRLVTNDDVSLTGAGRLEMYLGGSYTANGNGSEVESEGSWGTVCGEGFSLTAANVACRQMGYKGAVSWNYTIDTPYGVANESAPVAVSGVSCPGSYLWHFMRCNVDYEVSDNDCTHQKDVAVACSVDNIWDSPYQGQVRLNSPANYTMSSYGRVEVYQNGQWGTVCNKGFSQEGADSACRQLGYTGAIFTGSAFPGEGRIHVKDLLCDSSQSCFTNCFQPHTLIHDCNHTMDIAIQCQFNVNEASEYSAGNQSNCAITEFPLLFVVFGVLLGLAVVFLIGCLVIFMVSISRCCYKCRSKKKDRYEELY